MNRRIVLVALAACWAASAQKYDGPRPPKADIPYLKHASELVATEASEATTGNRWASPDHLRAASTVRGSHTSGNACIIVIVARTLLTRTSH